jgi:hypothetical protein
LPLSPTPATAAPSSPIGEIEVNLPPKTGALPKLTPAPESPATVNAPPSPPLVPPSKTEPPPLAKAGALPPAASAPPKVDSTESLFLDADVSEAEPEVKEWKELGPGELGPLPDDLQTLEAFSRTQKKLVKPSPGAPVTESKATPPPTPSPAPDMPAGTLPPPLPVAKTAEPSKPAPPASAKPDESHITSSVSVVPPMLEKAPEPTLEKLPQPHFPSEPSSPVPPAAAIPPEAKSSSPDVAAPVTLRDKAATPVVPPSDPGKAPPIKEEPKMALRPPVLPTRARARAVAITPEALEKSSASKETDKITPPKPSHAEKPAAWDTGETIQPGALKESSKSAPVPTAVPVAAAAKTVLPLTRAERAQRRRKISTIAFCVLTLIVGVVLYVGSLKIIPETRVEGQVIPPAGLTLSNEVWIVSDFRQTADGIADDLAGERTPVLQDIQERRDHVQRTQADIASREERIRLLMEEAQASKDEIDSIIKETNDQTQQIWDGPGAELDSEYTTKLNQLQQLIADRAKSLKLNYQNDETYHSPEVWANAYRLALYDVPPTIDSAKEHAWLTDQITQWRAFVKTLDDRKEALREKAAQIKLAPASKIADLNAKMDDLQHRITATGAEEVPLKVELQQAQADLAQSQATDAGLDDKYYQELYAIPEKNITNNTRIHLLQNGRFTWANIDADNAFAEGQGQHHYWIFARAIRPDGRQYWALGQFSIEKNQRTCLIIDPDQFLSTKAILRPDLSPDDQAQ